MMRRLARWLSPRAAWVGVLGGLVLSGCCTVAPVPSAAAHVVPDASRVSAQTGFAAPTEAAQPRSKQQSWSAQTPAMRRARYGLQRCGPAPRCCIRTAPGHPVRRHTPPAGSAIVQGGASRRTLFNARTQCAEVMQALDGTRPVPGQHLTIDQHTALRIDALLLREGLRMLCRESIRLT